MQCFEPYLSCPAGKNCAGTKNTDPESCPNFRFCPEGSPSITCGSTQDSVGTYNEDIGFLTKSSECPVCPPGKYCTDGKIQGDCNSGFICYGKSDEASPPVIQQNSLSNGEPCPYGYYCLQGKIFIHITIWDPNN